MKANVSFGKYGNYFSCAFCGNSLKELPSGSLLHPLLKGVFSKKRIDCVFIGNIFKNPFWPMTLEREQ